MYLVLLIKLLICLRGVDNPFVCIRELCVAGGVWVGGVGVVLLLFRWVVVVGLGGVGVCWFGCWVVCCVWLWFWVFAVWLVGGLVCVRGCVFGFWLLGGYVVGFVVWVFVFWCVVGWLLCVVFLVCVLFVWFGVGVGFVVRGCRWSVCVLVGGFFVGLLCLVFVFCWLFWFLVLSLCVLLGGFGRWLVLGCVCVR